MRTVARDDVAPPAYAGSAEAPGKRSGDTPCAVQRCSKSDIAERGWLVEAGAPALESAATCGGGAATSASLGEASRGRAGTRGFTRTGVRTRATTGATAGLTYVTRSAAGVGALAGPSAGTAVKRGELVRTSSAVAMVTPNAAAVLAARSVLEIGSARIRITRTFATAPSFVNCELLVR